MSTQEKSTGKKRNYLVFRFVFILLVFVLRISSQGYSQNLDEYLATAIQNSPLLKDYSFQLQSKLLDSLKVLAGFKPQAGLNADLMYPPALGKFAYDSAISDGGHYAAMVRVEQRLFYKEVAKGQLQSVAIEKLIINNSYKLSELDLKETVTGQYLTAFADFNQVQSDRAILKMLREQQSVLKLLVEKGIYQQTDYLNLMVSTDSRSLAAMQAYRQYKNDLAILNLICGIHDTAYVELKRPELMVAGLINVNASPNMDRFRIDSLKNLNDHLIIELAYKPRVGVFADAGFNAITPRRIPYNLGTSFGLSLTLPLYDGKQRQLEHKKVSLNENTRTIYKSFFETHFNQQKDQLTEQLSLTEGILTDMNKNLHNLENLIKLYQVEINRGMVRWLDYLTAINNYGEARIEIAQAEINKLQIINQLNYLK